MVAAIWAEVLGISRIGRNDNFFHLGGHSLLATRLLQEAMARAGFEPRFRRLQGSAVEVSLRDCPFRELADDHRDLVCTLHRGLVEGMLGGLKPPLGLKEFRPFVERALCRLRAG